MKKLFLFAFTVLFLFACKNSDNENENLADTLQNDTVSVDVTKNEIQEEKQSVETVDITDSYVYYASKSGIFQLKKLPNVVETLVTAQNINDFFIKNDTIIFSTYKDGSKELNFYKYVKNADKPVEVLKFDFSTVLDSLNSEFESNPEFYQSDIFDLTETSFKFFFYYYTDESEGPYSPTLGFEYDFKNDKLTEFDAYAFFDEQNTGVPQNDIQQEVEQDMTLSLDDGGLYYKDLLLVLDTIFTEYQRYYTEDNFFYVSPDGTRVLWAVAVDWLEGPMYDYYVVNLDGSGFVKIYFEKCAWVNNDILLIFSDFSGLKYVQPDNKIIDIDENVKKIIVYNHQGENVIYSPY